MRTLLLSSILVLSAVGCSSSKPTPVPEPPGPSTFRMSALLTGPQFGFDGRLDAQVKSEAISATPLRSRYQGEMTLVVNQGKETFLDMNTVINGEYDGSPTGGMVEALNRFMNAISLAERSAEKVSELTTSP